MPLHLTLSPEMAAEYEITGHEITDDGDIKMRLKHKSGRIEYIVYSGAEIVAKAETSNEFTITSNTHHNDD